MPPAVGLMLMFSNLKLSQGAEAGQWMPTATL